MRRFSNLLAVLIVCVMTAGAASAQSLFSVSGETADPTAPLLEDALTTDEAQALISRLSDEQVRSVLLEQMALKAQEQAAQTDAATSDFLYHATTGAAEQVIQPFRRIPLLVTRQIDAFQNFGNAFGAKGIVQFFLYLTAIVLAALGVEYVFRRATRSWHDLLRKNPDDQTLRQTVTSLFRRLCRDVLAVLVFIIAMIILSRAFLPDNMQVVAELIGPNLIALPRVTWALGRFVMAPDNPAYRIVRASNSTARSTVRNMVSLALFIGFSNFIVQFNNLNGVLLGETRLGFWLNAAVHFYVAWIAWSHRDDLAIMMRGYGDVTPIEAKVARAYPIFAIATALGTWWLVNILVSSGKFDLLMARPHYVTMALLMLAPAMDTTVRGLVRYLAPPMAGEGPVAERAHIATLRSYIRIGRVIVFGIVLVLLARVWGVDPRELAAAGVGERLAFSILRFLMVLSIGYLVYELASLTINRKLAAEFTASGYDPDNADFGGDGGGTGGSRLSTVLPLVLLVTRVSIIVLFLLLALGNIGVDTTPLLAGAGIVGLAIGFGAQKLVTDVVSGIFFLVDDAFRTGEYVTVEGTMGTVEKISLRSMQLRHHKGPVHTIPYGEIPKITNYSRDWVIMKLRFTVPFGTDPNKVKKIFKVIGANLLEHPELGDDFLQPFKSQGVLEIDDVGMVMRGKFMAKPGKQFTIRKEIYNQVSAAFAENGIEFARREVRVAMPEHVNANDLTDEERATIAAAASQAAQDQVAEAQPKDDR